MQVNRPLVSDAQVAAVQKALMGCDAGLWARGGTCDRELIGAIVAVLADAPPLSTDDERCAAAAAVERDHAVAACKAVLDENEEHRAYQASRDARGTEDELDRLRHHSTVSVYNAGIRRCIAAITK